MQVKLSPEVIQISSTNRCNMHCSMCPRRFFTLKEEDLSLPRYKKILSSLPPSVTRINLTGWGEPLLNPHIWKMVGLAKEKRLVVSLSTNATLLNAKNRLSLLKSGLDFLSVSFENARKEDNSSFSHPYSRQVLNNIAALMKKKGKRLSPHISFYVVLYKRPKRHLFPIISLARRLGIDCVHLATFNNELQKDIPGYTPKEELALWRETLQYKKGPKPTIITSSFLYLGIPGELREHSCPKIYNYLYIDVDGNVSPCCNLPKEIMGNILEKDLLSIWRGGKFKQWRMKQKSQCAKKCNLYRHS